MLGFWLEQPVWLMFLILLAGFMGVVALVHALSFSGRTHPHAARFLGDAPSFFSAPAVLIALLTGFVANDTWERQGRAARSDTIAIRRALRTYVEAVVTDEWPFDGPAAIKPTTLRAAGARIAADVGRAL